MKTPNLGVSKLQVLQVISDQTSMDIITAISNNVTNSGNLMHVLDISYKQYYDRSSRLLNIGLISRKNGQISLTSFGQQSAIENRDRLYTLFGIENDRCN